MRELDYLKEKLAYYKFWQGIVVVTDISLTGWTLSSVDEGPRVRVLLALLGIMLLTSGALLLHRRIADYIEQIRKP